MPTTTKVDELARELSALNNDETVDGILLQLPLPPALTPTKYAMLQLIRPDKDVDGLHAINVGRLMSNSQLPSMRPCTPLGIMHLLRHIIGAPRATHFLSGRMILKRGNEGERGEEQARSFIERVSMLKNKTKRSLWIFFFHSKGKTCTLVGASTIVGKPLAMELLGAGCTVTIAHERTPQDILQESIAKADILVVATGEPNLIPGVSWTAWAAHRNELVETWQCDQNDACLGHRHRMDQGDPIPFSQA